MGVLGVGHVVEDADQQQGHGIGEVQGPGGPGEDDVGVAEVGLDVGGPGRVAGPQQLVGVGQHHRVVVDRDHPGVGGGAQGDGLDVVGVGDARPDVEELADAGLGGEPADGPPEERPVGAGLGPGVVHAAHERRDLAGGVAIHGEVVRPAEQVVVDPGRVGDGAVDLDGVSRGPPRGSWLVLHGMPFLASDRDAS